MHYVGFVAVVLLSLARTGSCIKCYNCTRISAGSSVESTLTAGVNLAGCSKIASDTDVPLSECPNDSDVCVYLVAKVVVDTKDEDTATQILGSETLTIEARDCLSVPSAKTGCSDGIADQEAIQLLHRVYLSDKYESGRSCYCDESACDANECEGLDIAGNCVAWWVLGTGIGVSVGLILIIMACCTMCCRAKKQADDGLPKK